MVDKVKPLERNKRGSIFFTLPKGGLWTNIEQKIQAATHKSNTKNTHQFEIIVSIDIYKSYVSELLVL